MRLKNIISILLFLFFISCSNNNQEILEGKSHHKQLTESNIGNEYFGITPEDSLNINFPIDYSFEFIVDDLIGVETNKLNYILHARLASYHQYDNSYILKNGDTISFDPESYNSFEIVYPENENLFRGEWNYDGEYDGVSQYSRRFESEMYHSWDMRKYPFDTQRLIFKIRALQDTSIIRLSSSIKYPPYYENISSLEKGFQIDTIMFKESFQDSRVYFEDLDRNEVVSIGIFEIHLTRQNSWMFVKLFSGGILALFLAWLALFIPKGRDDSRIELSIGSIFAAVGNKYFVDSSVSSEVLTTSDILNNLVILFVVLNTAYLVWQMRRKGNKDYISPVWAFLISFSVFCTIASLIIIS